MRNVEKRQTEQGPTAARVAANVRAIRKRRNLSLEALSGRLSDLGHPIVKNGLWKIEAGKRRVDADDLMALAIALQTTPNRLLLDDVYSRPIGLTEDYAVADLVAWTWAEGDGRGANDEPSVLNRFEDAPTLYDFRRESRPHDPPVMLSPAQQRRYAPYRARRAQADRELRREVERDGLKWRLVVVETNVEPR